MAQHLLPSKAEPFFGAQRSELSNSFIRHRHSFLDRLLHTIEKRTLIPYKMFLNALTKLNLFRLLVLALAQLVLCQAASEEEFWKVIEGILDQHHSQAVSHRSAPLDSIASSSESVSNLRPVISTSHQPQQQPVSVEESLGSFLNLLDSHIPSPQIPSPGISVTGKTHQEQQEVREPLFADPFWGPRLEASARHRPQSRYGSLDPQASSSQLQASSSQVHRLQKELQALIEQRRPESAQHRPRPEEGLPEVVELNPLEHIRPPKPLGFIEKLKILRTISDELFANAIALKVRSLHPFTGDSLTLGLVAEAFGYRTAYLREFRDGIYIIPGHTDARLAVREGGMRFTTTKEFHLYVWKRTIQDGVPGSMYQLVGGLETENKASLVALYLTGYRTGRKFKVVGPDAVWDSTPFVDQTGKRLKTLRETRSK